MIKTKCDKFLVKVLIIKNTAPVLCHFLYKAKPHQIIKIKKIEFLKKTKTYQRRVM